MSLLQDIRSPTRGDTPLATWRTPVDVGLALMTEAPKWGRHSVDARSAAPIRGLNREDCIPPARAVASRVPPLCGLTRQFPNGFTRRKHEFGVGMCGPRFVPARRSVTDSRLNAARIAGVLGHAHAKPWAWHPARVASRVLPLSGLMRKLPDGLAQSHGHRTGVGTSASPMLRRG